MLIIASIHVGIPTESRSIRPCIIFVKIKENSILIESSIRSLADSGIESHIFHIYYRGILLVEPSNRFHTTRFHKSDSEWVIKTLTQEFPRPRPQRQNVYPSRQIGQNHAFLGVWRNWRALWLSTQGTLRAQCAQNYIRLHNSVPSNNSEICSCEVLSHDLIDSDCFLSISDCLSPLLMVRHSV